MSKKTIVISGVGPTFALYEGLNKHYQVAVLNKQAAERKSGELSTEVLCPLGGATSLLVDKSRNDAATLAASTVNALPSLASVDGAELRYADWLPGLVIGQAGEMLVNLRALDNFSNTDEIDVAGVVVHEDVTPVYKALALWGKAQDVPVIHVPHNNCYATARPDIHDESISDWILAAGPYMREWYVERGFDYDRVKVTGFVPWDGWAELKLSKEHARKVLHLDDRPVVTFCTGWAQRTNFVDDHDAVNVAVGLTMQAAKERNWQVVWKLHPGDAPNHEQQCAQIAAAHRVNCVVMRGHLAYALKAADVVLSAGPSNVLVEAGLCNRPPALFNLRGYGFPSKPPWSVSELSVDGVVETVEGLLDGALWSKKRNAFVRRYALRCDGKAGKRVVRQVKKILTEH